LQSEKRRKAYGQIELWRCPYAARCKRWWCRIQAMVIARYFDELGQPRREVELCECHAGELAKGEIAVRDMR
jgi:hypothetical protein